MCTACRGLPTLGWHERDHARSLALCQRLPHAGSRARCSLPCRCTVQAGDHLPPGLQLKLHQLPAAKPPRGARPAMQQQGARCRGHALQRPAPSQGGALTLQAQGRSHTAAHRVPVLQRVSAPRLSTRCVRVLSSELAPDPGSLRHQNAAVRRPPRQGRYDHTLVRQTEHPGNPA